MTKRNLRIAILMDTNRAYERGILQGVLKYARIHGPWTFLRKRPFVSGGPTTITAAMIKKWGADGIICREGSTPGGIRKIGLPVIQIPFTHPSPIYTNIVTDDDAIGAMAAEHLIGRGLKHFAYYGLNKNYYWDDDRRKSFQSKIRKAGFIADSFSANNKQSLKQWLSSIPRPFGLMGCTDDGFSACLETCRSLNLNIPDDISVIGVGNDELICDFEDPPLSSIALNTENAGYMAAQTLALMINRKSLEPDKNILVEPSCVIKRRSTDMLAIDDKHIASALKYIHDHVGEKMRVQSIVKTVPLARRTLYKRFRTVLGRSIYEEVRLVRMDYAAKMLIETGMSVHEIASTLGFTDSKNFARLFRSKKHMSPLKYRVKFSAYK